MRTTLMIGNLSSLIFCVYITINELNSRRTEEDVVVIFILIGALSLFNLYYCLHSKSAKEKPANRVIRIISLWLENKENELKKKVGEKE